jgi:DNA-binding IclR family transcriptional regulator
MRHPVTDIALLAYIAKKNARVLSYTEATKACKSSSSASRALHQLMSEGLIEPKPKLLGLRYVTQYVVTARGRQVAELALQLTQLREVAKKAGAEALDEEKQLEGEEKTPSTTRPPKTKKKPQHEEKAV